MAPNGTLIRKIARHVHGRTGVGGVAERARAERHERRGSRRIEVQRRGRVVRIVLAEAQQLAPPQVVFEGIVQVVGGPRVEEPRDRAGVHRHVAGQHLPGH